MNSREGIVGRLISAGYTKYRIAKEVGVSWNTVRLWQRGVFKPRLDHLSKLEELLNETGNMRGVSK